MLLWIVKAVFVLFFLLMFLRRSTWAWGVGLLTLTAGLFLDAFGEVFGRNALLDSLGFFQWIVGGALLAGAFLWLWGLLRPNMDGSGRGSGFTPSAVTNLRPLADVQPAAQAASVPSGIDRKLLYDQMRQNLGPDDVKDLIFDLDLNENDVINPAQDMPQILVRLIDLAEQRGQMGALARSVELTLTPPDKNAMPRAEKISAETPSPVLRQYLITNYDLAALHAAAGNLGVDAEQLTTRAPKKTQARELLVYLKRRNRLAELVAEFGRNANKSA